MKKSKIDNFIGGWIVGDFEPTIIRDKDIEVSVKYYSNGDSEKKHVHKIASEITIVANGMISMNGESFSKGEICILDKGEPCEFKCLADNTITVVIKSPSISKDKYFVE